MIRIKIYSSKKKRERNGVVPLEIRNEANNRIESEGERERWWSVFFLILLDLLFLFVIVPNTFQTLNLLPGSSIPNIRTQTRSGSREQKHVILAEICGQQSRRGRQQKQPHSHRQELRRHRRSTRRPSRRRGRQNPSGSHCKFPFPLLSSLTPPLVFN